MMLHFAYGSNMSRAQMGVRCPGAKALGTATLRALAVRHRGAVAMARSRRAPGAFVHGVLWRVGARDLAAINAYENLDSGLYVRRIVPVRHGARLLPALVYILRRHGEGGRGRAMFIWWSKRRAIGSCPKPT